MKILNVLGLLTITLSSISVAMTQTPTFTTLSYSGKNVFAGVKSQEKGKEPETYILQVSISEKFISTKVKLPKELVHREVIGIFPAQKEQILVISQRTVEQGDIPQFHLFDPTSKEWKKVAVGGCPSFMKIKFKNSEVSLGCLETDGKGLEKEISKRVKLDGVILKSSGEVSLPLLKVESGELKAELQGDAPEWNRLKIGLNNKEKVFTP
jgi:hypothetical protein